MYGLKHWQLGPHLLQREPLVNATCRPLWQQRVLTQPQLHGCQKTHKSTRSHTHIYIYAKLTKPFMFPDISPLDYAIFCPPFDPCVFGWPGNGSHTSQSSGNSAANPPQWATCRSPGRCDGNLGFPAIPSTNHVLKGASKGIPSVKLRVCY